MADKKFDNVDEIIDSLDSLKEEDKNEEEELSEENAALEAGITASLEDVEIVGTVQQSFLDYAMSVIVARAIPDVKDGLKPVTRRIIYGMYNAGYTPDKPTVKCSKIQGEIMGRYHPHGESSIYDALVRLIQDFSMRYPLAQGQGNFGNIDGDDAAAPRYTEARMNRVSLEMVKEMRYDTVDMIPTYDGSEEEPSVLPTKVPNLLINGSDGIAVGMATKMPPHNLSEVIDGTIAYINNRDISIEDLMQYIKAPDFPTGGILYGLGGIRDAYSTGRGSFKLRSNAEIIPLDNGKTKILITSVPYQVRKADLVKTIGELARDKVIDGITSIKDYSKKNIRVEIELRRDVEPQVILNKLYKATQLEISFGIINLCIVDGVPRILNLKEIIQYFLDFQLDILRRKTIYLKAQDEARIHIINALIKVRECIDEVIEMAKKAANPTVLAQKLIERFDFDEKQAAAVVALTIGRLTNIESQKLIDERDQLKANIDRYNLILSSEEEQIKVVVEELNSIKKRFGDERRTYISTQILTADDEDLIAEDEIVICLTKNGYAKRMSTSEFKAQNRGGVGVRGMGVYSDDEVVKVEYASTHSDILFFSTRGRVYRKRGHQIPEASRTAKGIPLVNLLNLDKDESIVSIICIQDKEDKEEYLSKYLFFATKKGVVKRTALQEFKRINVNGKIAISFKEDDTLLDVKETDGKAKILLATKSGQLAMFEESEVRTMGRTAAGVKGMNIKGSEAISLATSLEGNQVLVLSENGLGKYSPIEDYRLTHRGSSGVITMKINNKTGALIAMKVVNGNEDYLAIKTNGVIIRSSLTQVRSIGRNTSGVKMVNLQNSEKVSSVAILPPSHDDALETAETSVSEEENKNE